MAQFVPASLTFFLPLIPTLPSDWTFGVEEQDGASGAQVLFSSISLRAPWQEVEILAFWKERFCLGFLSFLVVFLCS